MHNHSRRFADDQKGIVLIENIKRNLFRCNMFHCCFFRRFEFDPVPFADRLSFRRLRFSVQQDLRGGDAFLNLHSGKIIGKP